MTSPQILVRLAHAALRRGGPLLALAAAFCLGVGHAIAQQTSPAAAPVDRAASRYEEKPAPIAGLEIVEHLGEKLPLDLAFVDSTGDKVTLGKWFNQGRPVLVMFVYYRCPLACPQLMERYVRTFRSLDGLTIGKDYNVVVVSIDPTDTPKAAAEQKQARLNSYDRRPEKDVAAGWAFLTSPDSAAPRRLADALGFPYRYSPAANDYSHPSLTFVAGSDGTVSRYLYGLETPAQTLKLSLVEAGEGKIGTSLDRVALWCYHFDPKSGSYTFAAWRLMQIGGFLSAVMVAGLLVRMLMVEWRRKHQQAAAAAMAAAGAAGIKNVQQGGGAAELAR